jgi:hypothetical protein
MTKGQEEKAHLVNVDQSDLLDALVLEAFTDNTTVTSTDNKNVLGVWVRSQGDVGDHLLVAALVS